jgi:hypothetical protein
MKIKATTRIMLILSILLTAIPVGVSANSTPPVDMFQLPWEQGKAWVSYDGLDNGWKRPSTSPHNYRNGGAIDFAPRINMVVGEDTSNDWVTAAAAGTVTQVGSCFVKIDHGNGWVTEYWHLDNIQVTTGSTVSRNQKLAIIHNNKTQQVCLGNEYPGPHLHFVFRPKIVDARLAGWTVNYNAFTNKTTYTKNGVTVPILTPLMNLPDLQTVMRGLIDWNINYEGSVDTYRRERWTLVLIEDAKFEVNVTPSAIGLVPVIVLLDSSGNEIERANGILNTTQPGGFYYVEIQSEAGTGYYNLIATKEESGGATVTPSPTETIPGTGTPSGFETPTPTGTLTGSETPVPTETFTLSPDVTNTPIATFTSTPFDGATETPFGEATLTPNANETSIAGTSIASTLTAIASTSTAGTIVTTPTLVPTPTGPYVLVDVIQATLTFDQTSLVNVSLNNVLSEGYTSVELICSYDPLIVEVSGILAAELFGSDPASALSGPQNGQFILGIAGSNGKKATSSGTAFTFAVRGLQAGQTTIQCTARVSTGQGVLQPIGYIPDVVTVLDPSVSPTPEPPASAFITGQVLASKPVTIQLYDSGNALVISQIANPDGTFNLQVDGGTYTIIAAAQGFLNAQGFVTLTNGVTATMQTIRLPAGDIDGNSVIDQFDALTIGMNYNASFPAAADLNNDGVVNVLDLELLAANYRKSGALAWQ